MPIRVCGEFNLAEVINLAQKREAKPIPPKTDTFEHAGQRYTCRFDSNAPPGQQWVWIVNYTRVYRYFGSGPTMEAVAAFARRKIHMMNLRQIAQEEEREAGR